MTTWKHIKHACLGALIVLSLFLSVSLWSAGGHLGEPQETVGSQNPSPLVERTRSEVFSSSSVALHGTGEAGNIHVVSTYDVQEIIDDVLEEIEFEEIVETSAQPIEEYQEYLTWGTWIELVYPDGIPLGLLEENFDDLPENEQDWQFDRLAINLNDLEQAEFYNTADQEVARAQISQLSSTSITEFLNTDDIPYVQMTSEEIGSGVVYLPTEPLEIEHKIYTVDRLPTQLYINQFFTDTLEMDSRTTGNTTRYIDMTSEVRVNQDEQRLTYESQQTSVDDLTLTERLDRSFNQLQEVENWTNEVKFDSYDPQTNQVVFQRYLDGLPIFSFQHNDSRVQMNVNNNGLSYLSLPLRIIQTPLDTGENLEELASGEELMEQLDAIEMISREDINDIRLGLTWEESEEDGRVIHFVPDWYVKVEDTWYEVERFIDMQEELFNGL